MKIAIMQPAFIPPASYFRLFAASDLFVVYDDVQFDRRWYTHRQKLTNIHGEKEWMTLPLAKKKRDTTRIIDLEWHKNCGEVWYKNWEKYPINYWEKGLLLDGYDFNLCVSSPPLKFIVNTMSNILDRLGMKNDVVYSSDLCIENVSGQDRIISICKKWGAKEYINSPGGISLYDENSFLEEGINLTFLPSWQGNCDSMVERLSYEQPEKIKKEIYDNI